MTKLSDTQATILFAAAQRRDGNLLPLPGSLRRGAAVKVVGALLARGLAREEATERTTPADRALNTIWRNEDDGRAVLLRVTPAGLEPIGLTPESEQEAERAEDVEVDADAGGEAAGAPTAGHTAKTEVSAGEDAGGSQSPRTGRTTAQRKAGDGTKQVKLIAMLRRAEGATIAQIVAATGWQPHTVRGAFAGALKKKLGLTVTSEKPRDRRSRGAAGSLGAWSGM
jgi:DNA-binding MarR family transcriptional regulator